MIKVIKKAVLIIDIVASKCNASFSDIQKASKFNKSTLSHIISTLCDSGYLEKGPSGNYTIGGKLYQITRKETPENALVETSERHAGELVRKINEFVVVALRHEEDRLNLCRLRPQKSLQVSIGDFNQYPSGWYSTATGRILLAFATETERKKIISEAGAPSHSIWPEAADEKSLEAELDKIKEKKVAYLNFDKIIDVIAVPVKDADGVFSISIACVLPISSYETINKNDLLTQLKHTAAKLTKELTLKGISAAKIKKIPKEKI